MLSKEPGTTYTRNEHIILDRDFLARWCPVSRLHSFLVKLGFQCVESLQYYCCLYYRKDLTCLFWVPDSRELPFRAGDTLGESEYLPEYKDELVRICNELGVVYQAPPIAIAMCMVAEAFSGFPDFIRELTGYDLHDRLERITGRQPTKINISELCDKPINRVIDKQLLIARAKDMFDKCAPQMMWHVPDENGEQE